MAGDALTGCRRLTTASKHARVKSRRRRRSDGSENYNDSGGRGDWPTWMRCSRPRMDWCRAPRGRVKVSELRVPMDPLNPGAVLCVLRAVRTDGEGRAWGMCVLRRGRGDTTA